MSADEKDQTSSKDSDDDQGTSSDTPELSDEGKEKVRKMREEYEDRETAVLPGTNNTITGTAVNEWLDDEGNPKFGKEEQQEREEKEGHDQEGHDQEGHDEHENHKDAQGA